MIEQNYATHKRIVPMYHYVLFGVIVLSIIGAFVNLFKSLDNHETLYSASLLVVTFCCLALIALYMRSFALHAQDRAIRAEENLRHFVLTGKLLDGRLSVYQIVALRFASDAEFVALAKRAADENLAPDQVKKAIQSWRPDHHRV